MTKYIGYGSYFFFTWKLEQRKLSSRQYEECRALYLEHAEWTSSTTGQLSELTIHRPRPYRPFQLPRSIPEYAKRRKIVKETKRNA
ncbi:hypothetical protein Y032_0839g2617 [Ancylostoma ceylanicum]|uniref:Uncharacterized protein n=1 Tax=Ancylostoma ceylanicum TaxID=53326 RepID=A0A016WBG7_9BILA|nr:hypothetical protein Y032_0839g2617 [Ancylostoma ceylanicum]